MVSGIYHQELATITKRAQWLQSLSISIKFLENEKERRDLSHNFTKMLFL